jgi:uncharacterized protein YndB with AHSA1/START domain
MSQDRDSGTLEIVREIRATPDRVYRAFTNPEELLQWWGTEAQKTDGTKPFLAKAQSDLRQGGRYRYEFKMPDGGIGWLEGEFRVLEPPRRIVQTFISSSHPDMETTVEIRLEPIAGGTRLTLRHSGLEGRPDAAKSHELGWIAALTHLASWLIAVGGVYLASPGREVKE